MRYQYIPYIWPLMLSAFVPLSLGIYAYIRHRNAKGAKSFIASMLVVTVWSGANALEMSGSDLQTKLFWANMQYFAIAFQRLRCGNLPGLSGKNVKISSGGCFALPLPYRCMDGRLHDW